MEKEELLKIKQQVFENEKNNLVTIFDGQVHAFNIDDFIKENNINIILDKLYRNKNNILKISNVNPRWINDYAMVLIMEALESKYNYVNDNLNKELKIVEKLTADNDALLEKLNNLEDALNEQKELLKQKENELIDAKNDTELQDKLSEAQNELNKLNDNITEYEKRVGDLNKQNDDNHKVIESLSTRINELENDILLYGKSISEINNSTNMLAKKMSTGVSKYRMGASFETGPNIGV